VTLLDVGLALLQAAGRPVMRIIPGRSAHLQARFERTDYGSGHIVLWNVRGAEARNVEVVKLGVPRMRRRSHGRPQCLRLPIDRLAVGSEATVPLLFLEHMKPPINVHVERSDRHKKRRAAVLPVWWGGW
jgi:hypothetical protein